MLPFFGKVHIAYYPKSGVIGLSKFARVVWLITFARRLQTQEALTAQIAAAVEESGAARGVAVLVEAEHMCVAMRGISKQGVSTVTTLFTGVFKEDPAEQVKFMTLISRRPLTCTVAIQMRRRALPSVLLLIRGIAPHCL